MRNVFLTLTLAVCSFWLADCSRSVGPASTRTAAAHSPAARPRSVAANLKGSSPSPAPAGTATPKASPSSAASEESSSPAAGASLPPPIRSVPRVAPNAAPKILQVDVSETTVHPGDTVSGRVVTTSNVASVEARIGGYAMSLVKVGVGRFALTYTVAQLPWFVRGNFTMRVIAKNTRGDTVERQIPLTVR